MKLINQARAAKSGASIPARTAVPASQPRPPVSGDSTPACPRCGGQMVKRVAKQGANAGKEFWGCKRFPECRGVKGLSEATA